MKFVKKVCCNPYCSEIAINCDIKETKCRNCNSRMIRINDETFNKKFINDPWIIDYTPKQEIIFK